MDETRKRATDSLLTALSESFVEPGPEVLEQYFEAWERFEPQLRPGDNLKPLFGTFHNEDNELCLSLVLITGSGNEMEVFDSLESPQYRIKFKQLYEWEPQ